MSNLITLDGLALRSDPTGQIHAWIRQGFYGPADYRGGNDVLPEAAGEFVGPWVASKRVIVMPMMVKGTGASEVLAQQNFLSLMDSIVAKWEASQATPKELRVYAPLYGIASGYRKLNVRYVGDTSGDPTDGMRQLFEVRYECVDSPPSWVAVP